MLVLSRKPDESLIVGDITVTVTKIEDLSVTVTMSAGAPFPAATDTEVEAAKQASTELIVEPKSEWSFVIERDRFVAFGDNCVLSLVDVRGDKVRLGVDAPRHVPVHRKEVYDAIQRQPK